MANKWKTLGLSVLAIIIVSLFVSNLYVVYTASQNKNGYVTVGIPASPGINGNDGRNGKDGANGRDGVNGSNGLNGDNGLNGISGVDGANGLNGKDGTNGLQGPIGNPGPDPQMRCENNTIQWKKSTDTSWNDLERVLSCTQSTEGERYAE